MEVRWGKYDKFEGPWCPGDVPFTLSKQPSLDERILATITATEGGKWNAVNMYDRCICTVGLIQWCEAGQFSVSDMIQKFLDVGGNIDALRPVMEWGGLEFKKHEGKGRFWMGGKVVTQFEQSKLFRLNSDGKIGNWDANSQRYAKLWTSSLAKLFAIPLCIETQRKFTIARVRNYFTLNESKEWIQRAVSEGTPGADAFICGYLSFAANNPTWAYAALKDGLSKTTAEPFSTDWLVTIFDSLTWHPNVSIYPHRYNKIRPVLETMFGIDLPDLSEDLRTFRSQGEILAIDQIQSMLVRLGHDLGSSGPEENGVDDVWGSRTARAFQEFERKAGLHPDGKPDPKACAALRTAVAALG